jgi:hypothetical protein
MGQNWGVTKSIKKRQKNEPTQTGPTCQTRDPSNEIALTSQKTI